MIPPFELHRPDSVEEALAIRSEAGHDGLWLAGGTELLLAMKLRYVEVDHLIDIKRLAELSVIESKNDGSIRMGATAKYHALCQHAGLTANWPAFTRLITRIGNPRVRSVGTLGGNICFAEPKSDPLIFLTAADGQVVLRSQRGTRRLPVSEFVTGPYTTDIDEDELLVAVELPAPHAAAYEKFQILERPSVGIAIVGDVEDGVFVAAPTVAVGGAGARVTVCSSAGRLLEGRPLSAADEGVRKAAWAAAEEMVAVSEPFATEAYKRRLVAVMLPRMVGSMVPVSGGTART